jgi:phenylalanyl-tRNA synthetase alpha chain
VQQSIEQLQQQFQNEIKEVGSSRHLEDLKVKFLGKKGPVQQLMQVLKDVTPQDRPAYGKKVNDLKEWISAKCEEMALQLTVEEEGVRLSQEAVDISMPGRRKPRGRMHPLTQAMEEIIEILSGMGFTVQHGPDIDTDYYNFEVLNFPPEHPARDMQDTFYISPHVLLRTHTSNIQARVMEAHKPPIRIIAPGKVYRNETITARSHVFFHQVEAVYIDKDVTFADLFATFDQFLSKLFKKEIATRYRPSYFPFVEPGVEVDIGCLACAGSGCPLCKHSGWLEIAGAGMVHPNVLKNGGIDPEEYSGFAWGLGLERLVIMLRGIQDIRLFAENDLRFLNQFTAL